MSSTEFTVGLEGGRNSSKVLKPPGGGSSDIFNLGAAATDVEKEKKVDQTTTKNRLFGPGDAASPVSKAKVRRNPITGEGYGNPITGEGYGVIKDAPDKVTEPKELDEEKFISDSSVSEKAKDTPNKANDQPTKVVQTSIRVRNPPGGKSSGIF